MLALVFHINLNLRVALYDGSAHKTASRQMWDMTMFEIPLRITQVDFLPTFRVVSCDENVSVVQPPAQNHGICY